jgi:FG-GAP repeat
VVEQIARKFVLIVCMLTLTCVFVEAKQKTNSFVDFNGDGFTDLALPVPFEDFQGQVDAGGINIQYGTANGFKGSGNQFITVKSMKLTPVAGDLFGWEGIATDVSGDGITDLIVGAPGRTNRSGAVYIIPGSPTGLLPKQATELAMPTVSNNEPNLLGSCITAGDFNGDGGIDIAAGAPGFSTSSKANLGAMAFFTQISQALRASKRKIIGPNMLINPDSPNIKGTGQAGERFGYECAAGLFNDDSIADFAVSTQRPSGKGSVHILFGGIATSNFESNKMIKGKKDDRAFGFALNTDRSITPNRLFIGAPNSLGNKGRVYSLANATTLELLFTASNNGDLAGWALASYFNPGAGTFLAIGLPGFDVPTPTPSAGIKIIEDGGQVVVMSINPNTEIPSFFDDFSDPNARLLGHSLTSTIGTNGTGFIAGAPGTSLVGAPDVGESDELVFDSSAGGLSLIRIFTQNSRGVKDSSEPRDMFGYTAINFIPQ